MLDAATGHERGRFSVPPEAATAGDTDWKWLAQEGDKLWAAFGPPDAHVAAHREKRQMGHWPWDVANQQYKSITDNFGAARRLAAFQYPEMKLLWTTSEPEAFDARALCMKGGRIFELAPGKYAAARDSATGNQLWRRTPDTSKELFDAVGSSLKRQAWGLGWVTYCCARASSDVVCIAGPPFKKTIGTGGKLGGGPPWDVMQVPTDDSILWAGDTADVCGLAVGDDGLVVLHQKSVEGVSADGLSLWTTTLPAPPVRWGVAVTGNECVVTLSDGHVVCLAKRLDGN